MEKRLFLFIILFMLFLMTACGNDQENYMGGGDPNQPEETEEPAGTDDNSTDDSNGQNDDKDDSSGSDDNGENGETDDSNNSDDNGENDASDDNGDSEQALQVMEHDSHGQYLADSEGMTLYYFTNDEPDTSNCTDDCLVNWPAFAASDIDEPEGYEDDDFGTITREDNGEEQVTYKGYPLYYFVNDMAEGDVNGQGVNNEWYIVNDTTEFPE